MTTYDEKQPRQFGDIQQRMKFLIALVERYGEDVPHDINVAVYDLETAVKLLTGKASRLNP